jgi:hypothetical protein
MTCSAAAAISGVQPGTVQGHSDNWPKEARGPGAPLLPAYTNGVLPVEAPRAQGSDDKADKGVGAWKESLPERFIHSFIHPSTHPFINHGVCSVPGTLLMQSPSASGKVPV